jgi:hypothetical protein
MPNEDFKKNMFLTLIPKLISVLTYHLDFSTKEGSLLVEKKENYSPSTLWLKYFQVALSFRRCKIHGFVAFSMGYPMTVARILVN